MPVLNKMGSASNFTMPLMYAKSSQKKVDSRKQVNSKQLFKVVKDQDKMKEISILASKEMGFIDEAFLPKQTVAPLVFKSAK